MSQKSNKSFFLPLNIRFDSRSIKVPPVELKKAQSIWRVSSNSKQKMSFRNFSIKQSTFHVPEVLGTDNASHWSKTGHRVNLQAFVKKLKLFFGYRNVSLKNISSWHPTRCCRDVFDNWCTSRHPISFPTLTTSSKENIDVYLCLKFIVPQASNLLPLPSFPLSKPLKTRRKRTKETKN